MHPRFLCSGANHLSVTGCPVRKLSDSGTVLPLQMCMLRGFQATYLSWTSRFSIASHHTAISRDVIHHLVGFSDHFSLSLTRKTCLRPGILYSLQKQDNIFGSYSESQHTATIH